MSTIRPTAEQDMFVDAGIRGDHIAGIAGAGTGKTTTAMLMARGLKGNGLYAAFNKPIAQAAKATFPAHVDCRTVHSLAYAAVGKRYKQRLAGARQPAREVARLLKINGVIPLGGAAVLQPTQIARLAVDTVTRFCRTMDREITYRHVPHLIVPDPNNSSSEPDFAIRRQIVPFAVKIWEDLQLDDTARFPGKFRFVHDHYLKMWADTNPTLPYDFVILDEAQDADPVIAAVIMAQTSHAQGICIGDRCQAIYGWRGSIDVMGQWPGNTTLYLTESFRFGQPVANEANKWLELIGTPLRLVGRGGPSRVGELIGVPDAILCRTNGTAMREAMTMLASGRRTAIVGGGDQIRRMAEAAVDLQAGRGTEHPELCVFRTWGEVQDYVTNEDEGSDLRTAVKLIDEHGADVILAAVARLVPDKPSKFQRGSFRKPDVVVSTAHKAKGLDWPKVKVADDFREPDNDPTGQPKPVSREAAMLAYVTVTRAKHELDRGSLAYIDNQATLAAATI